MNENDRMSRTDAARVLGVSVQTIDRYAAADQLPRHKNRITGRVWFHAHDVEALRKAREDEEHGR